jgi:hypothetical protein
VTAQNDDLRSGLIEHVHRAVDHGLGALRCYVALFAAESRRVLDQALWVLLLTGMGVVGMTLFACGAAQWIESRMAVPGSGAMTVGMGLMVIFLAIVLTRVRRKARGL